MNREESKIQEMIARHVLLAYPDVLMSISPAGFIMSIGMAMRMSRMGYKKGTPDLLFFEPRGGYHGLLLEVKTAKGVPTKEQIKFLDAAQKRGFKTEICYTVEAGIAIIDKYMSWPVEL